MDAEADKEKGTKEHGQYTEERMGAKVGNVSEE